MIPVRAAGGLRMSGYRKPAVLSEAVLEQKAGAEESGFHGGPGHFQECGSFTIGAAIEIAETDGHLVHGIKAANLVLQKAQ